MSISQRALALAALCSLCGTARSQTITKIVETGDVVPGIGTVLAVGGVTVDSAGHAYARAWTNNANPNTADTLIDQTGALAAYAGEPLANGLIKDFQGGNFTINAAGTLALNLNVFGDTGGIFYGLPPVIVVHKSSIATAPQLSPGSHVGSMLYPKINGSNQIAFHAVVSDPAIPGITKALFLVDAPTAAQNVIVKTTDVLPGQTLPVTDLAWNRHRLAISDSGHVIYTATIGSTQPSIQVLYRDTTKLAQSAEMSPFGTTYSGFQSVSTNSFDDYAFGCRVNDWDDDYAIATNHGAFMRLGDSYPSIEPFKIDGIGNPLFLCDDGRTFWMGTWQMPGFPQSEGIFADYALVVSTVSTLIGGVAVTELTGLDGQFSVSPSGQYLVFEATLQNGVKGAYLMDLWQ